MAGARGLRICAVVGILMASACSSGAKEATCATDSGAQVCVMTQGSSALR